MAPPNKDFDPSSPDDKAQPDKQDATIPVDENPPPGRKDPSGQTEDVPPEFPDQEPRHLKR